MLMFRISPRGPFPPIAMMRRTMKRQHRASGAGAAGSNRSNGGGDRNSKRRLARARRQPVSNCWEPLPCTLSAAAAPTAAVEAGVIEDSPWGGLPLERGSQAVSDKDARASQGAERECWRQAAHEEVHDSFYLMGAVPMATAAGLARVGCKSGVLPMKAV